MRHRLCCCVLLIGVLSSTACGSSSTTVDSPPPDSAADTVASPEEAARWREAFPLTPLPPPVLAGATPLERQLNAAFEPYRRGDYAAAASALDGVRLDHPDDPVAALYLGISRLFMDEVPNGLEILRSIPGSASAEVMAEAEWYGLVGIARLRNPSAALPEAKSLCARG
ncbi:MAG: hypothetical protein IT178_17600, partial [Acidobacteria bacterium]|nr:hypothetical protein [Acidobacteriota bacterium]